MGRQKLLLCAVAVGLVITGGTAWSVVPMPIIGDRVWNDLNGDGFQDAGEPGLNGWTVTLYAAYDTGLTTPITGTTTAHYEDGSSEGVDGWYRIALHSDGDYIVVVTPPPGWTETWDLDGLDSLNAAIVGVVDGQYRTDVDFGYRQAGSIGDRVWNDLNGNGVQDAGEPGLVGWTVTLSGDASATTNTGADGIYEFTQLPPGNYTVTVTAPEGWTQTYDLDGLATANTASVTLGAGQNRTDVDFGYCQPLPGVRLAKDVDRPLIGPGDPLTVTYSYTVTNTGNVPLSNITVVDDNGTPGDTTDDFVVGTISSLEPGEAVTLTASRTLALSLCASTTSGTVDAGTLATEILPNGDVKVTFVESRGINDNVYGTPAAADGWPKGHKFTDLTGSDKAQFRFTDSTGKVVLDFCCDYISASTAFPSGYGCLGAAGGDGSMVAGSISNIISCVTSESLNLNQAPAFYGYRVNSPAEPNAAWNYNIMYQVVVKGTTFGTAGFGGVSIPAVHNSPSKIGQNAITPTPCDSTVTNTAVAAARAGDGTVLTASDQATVIIDVTSGSPGHYVTYTQSEWGGSPAPGTAGALLAANFATIYPSALVVGGRYTLSLTSAAAVDALLPTGGGPASLSKDYTNPTSTSAGELAGNTVALKLNVDYSATGITKKGLGDLHLKSGKLAGRTVSQVLAIANAVLGGDKSLLVGLSIKDLNGIIKSINLDYEKGTTDRGYLIP